MKKLEAEIICKNKENSFDIIADENSVQVNIQFDGLCEWRVIITDNFVEVININTGINNKTYLKED
uniref:Uncharacterized protein n=1 Tax=viral metagenome TaxID=1070528 RepID=A0A6M3L6L0_9ZZZZ